MALHHKSREYSFNEIDVDKLDGSQLLARLKQVRVQIDKFDQEKLINKGYPRWLVVSQMKYLHSCVEDIELALAIKQEQEKSIMPVSPSGSAAPTQHRRRKKKRKKQHTPGK